MKTLTIKQAQEKLASILPSDIRMLATIFNRSRFDLFLVGGSVRDTFLGLEPKDFDVCTNANTEQIINILKSNNIDFNLQGEHFGVVVAKLSEDVEIASFRTDISQDTGSNKDTIVKIGCTIEEDVQRRDLTINGLFMNLTTNEIIDLVNGVNDLQQGICRFIGDANERLREDNLRSLRLIVRATKLKFNIEKKSFIAIQNLTELNIAKERILTELLKVDTNFDFLHKLLFESKLIFKILPNFNITECHNNVISINTMFVNILQNEDINILFKKLHVLKFPNEMINNIIFLIKIIKTEITEINPFHFFNDRKKISLSKNEILQFFDNDKNIEILLNFKPSSTLSQELMELGLSSKELGKAIEQFYFDNRLNILK